jgi:glutathione synthase
MKIGFCVNNLLTEDPRYTTTGLAMAASRMGHESWYINVGDFAYDQDEAIHAHARRVANSNHRSGETYLRDLWGKEAIRDYINVSGLDVLLLRNDPAEDFHTRPWARLAGINFGRFAASNGVLVLNDPEGLANAVNKLYLQQFPQAVRPRSLITRDRDQIKAFARAEGGTIVLKPLSGSGGRNVFLLRSEDAPNMNQIIEAVSRDGYIIAQQHLPEAVNGDTRLFLLNGEPLQYKGRIAAIRRVRANGDMRSNITAGAMAAPAEINDRMLEIAEIISPRLKQDGMFFVGLDIVGDKLMEINVFSPGGLDSAEAFEQVNFSKAIIKDIERKVESGRHSPHPVSNRELATL